MLAHGQWFSPGTLATSTTKIGHHDIAEILMKVALNTIKSNQIKCIKGSLGNWGEGGIFLIKVSD